MSPTSGGVSAAKSGSALSSLCPEGVSTEHADFHSILCTLTEAMHSTAALLKTSKIIQAIIKKNYTRKIFSGIRKA